ncbi:MAG TPA: hypothetical protein VM493_07595 [Vicinamibacterales bacterium]|nr:hypothetical protein [Vicinamibacterales bacterium]
MISLQILQAKHLDLEIVAVTGDLVAANARFNLWFAESAKQSDDEEKVLGLLEMYEECVASLERAAERFMNDRARDELIEVERDLAARLKAAMA